MAYLVVGVVLLCVLCLFDLLLTLGVIRRLREHENRLEGSPAAGPLDNVASSLAPGARPGPFAATATNGDLVTSDAPADGTVVAFMSPHCKPCVSNLPSFIEAAATLRADGRRVVAVLMGEDVEARPLAARLEPVAQVVVEPFDGPLATAFKVTALPATFVLKGDGTVAATSYEIGQLVGQMAAVVR